ncbi:MAG TPA: glycosyltransferase family 1 protein, partial [Bryobacteraceae bacterium]|nr:glycosyltransferase family 1 protein [Bryobacteraceae bacterium]
IANAYGLNAAAIAVVPNAASPVFRPMDRKKAEQGVLARFGISGPFLLSVGDLQPRKNQVGLVRAFAEMTRALPRLPHSLVLAGQDTWFSGRVREAVRASGVADKVHLTGFVTDEELVLLYNACDVFVFPSLYEGFGLPLLEAMACGRAVACSDVSACPEVADAAAVFFDPYSTHDMARAMSDLVQDQELRARMERLGLNRAAHFSWRKTAEMTLDVYREVAGQARVRTRPLKSAVVAP